jgi:hypothetical protein
MPGNIGEKAAHNASRRRVKRGEWLVQASDSRATSEQTNQARLCACCLSKA